MLIERIGMQSELDPFSAAGDNRKQRRPRIGHPHVVLQLGHVFFGGGLFRERPGQHEFGFEHCAGWFDHAVECRRHPFVDGMLDVLLYILDHVAAVALVPAPVEVFGNAAELNNQIVIEILRLDFAALLAPQPNEIGLITTHYDPGIGAADKGTAMPRG
jgi:hypothetical protein